MKILLYFFTVVLFSGSIYCKEFQTTKNIRKDWAKLERLLADEKNDIGDKRKWVFLFTKEYGYDPQKNPYIYQLIQRQYIQFNTAFTSKTIKTEKEARDIIIKGNYLFLADGPGGVLIFDISNPIKPKKISEIKNIVYAAAIYIDDEYIYIAQGQAGFSVWDISDPSDPKLICSQYSNVESIYAKKPHVYVADGNNSLSVFDISNPSSVKKVASYRKFYKALSVTGDGNYIYVADANKKLYKFMFKDDKLSLISFINIDGETRNMTVDGKYLYTASLSKGIFIIDTESFKIEKILKDESVQNIYIGDKKIFTIARESGVKILDAIKISKIAKIAYFDIEGYGEDIAAKDSVIYIANSDRGLLIFYPNSVKDNN